MSGDPAATRRQTRPDQTSGPDQPLRCSISVVSWGTTVNRSPTSP
jgi:hypothetical protein